MAAGVYLFYPSVNSTEAVQVQTESQPLTIPVELPDLSSPLQDLEPTVPEPEPVVLHTEKPIEPPELVVPEVTQLEEPQNVVEQTPVAVIAVEVETPVKHWQKVTIGKGDNLSIIFRHMGLSPSLLYKIINHDDQTRELKRVLPGQDLQFLIEQDELKEMIYFSDQMTSLHIRVNEGTLSSEKIVLEPTRRVISISAEIDSSLFLAAMRAGLSDNLTMQLAEIFGWDIDFALNIRKGDRFSVIYEELYKDDTKIRDGAILAAEFVNQGDTFRAIRYEDADGHVDYYSDTGDSMRKAFLRTPVKFSRISSGFSTGRKHPVLNRIRAHHGVDYAAPTGTPVKASGDGRVVMLGRKGGYGKTVILQHGGAYSTLYAHLNTYAKGLRNGKQVRQGQIIGYVGSTGLATGPHLHYEFRVNGVHRNPLTVKLPKATPIPEKFREDFKRKAEKLTAQLDSIESPAEQRITASSPTASSPTRLATNEQ
jgi:murein DD-endopeptidase MepM/ murein hydrolase activator NlpD